MANIQTFLQNILSARYGKDVRQSIHDAIEEVDKVADTAQGSATEAAAQAEQYRNETEQLRNEVAEIVPEGYADLVEQVQENTVKVDTIIEKADLGIKETASGEEIHLTDSAEGKAVEFALFGKARQDGEPTPENPIEIEVSGESYNLFENKATSKTVNGVEFVVNEDKSITVNGTANGSISGGDSVIGAIKLKNGKYILSGCPSGGSNETYRLIAIIVYEDGKTDTSWRTFGNEVEFNVQGEVREILVRTDIMSGVTANNLTFYPMIRKASVKNDSYMPFGVGSVEVTSSNEDETKITKATIPTPNGLAGIKVSSNGNYTDQNGQQWICDEVVKYADGSGKHIQRLKYMRVESIPDSWVNINGNPIVSLATDGKSIQAENLIGNVISNVCQTYSASNQFLNDTTSISVNKAGKVCFAMKNATNVDDIQSFIDNNDMYILYELATPIETPLTAEELAEISTFYPITNISNDFDCGMSVKYPCDSKNYIDNKIALLTTAMINNI